MGPPGKLSPGPRERNKTGRSLRMLSIELKTSQSSHVRDQEMKARAWYE